MEDVGTPLHDVLYQHSNITAFNRGRRENYYMLFKK
jgi:hypothetical protein